eukprot:CAMPEP_0183331584 /NCGR_PEP_ID=MMETSP0164_2-20130417/929_1 /TAXON_ID=221442 /ORGANISM="Coccolithus pelagicus ssp braarudi, Strain PLY182g" /LENGTH=61 /DNA_ID=CAMNT_0025500097 /DNA_START=611 /DNA_END=794 /DNA_ORIENTATION=-
MPPPSDGGAAAAAAPLDVEAPAPRFRLLVVCTSPHAAVTPEACDAHVGLVGVLAGWCDLTW